MKHLFKVQLKHKSPIKKPGAYSQNILRLKVAPIFLGPYSLRILVQRVAPSDKTLRKFLLGNMGVYS